MKRTFKRMVNPMLDFSSATLIIWLLSTIAGLAGFVCMLFSVVELLKLLA